MVIEGRDEVFGGMAFYYPIPAGTPVTCMHCGGLLREHLNEAGGWRGCITMEGDSAEMDGAVPVFLVTERRKLVERRTVAAEYTRPMDVVGAVGVVTPPIVVPARPATMVAGPRAAVYVAAHAGVQVSGQRGKMAAVLDAIVRSGERGKSSEELRKELKIKPKSLESILYRLRLGQWIRSYNASEVRR